MIGGAWYPKVVLFDLSFKGVSTDVHPDLLRWGQGFFDLILIWDQILNLNFTDHPVHICVEPPWWGKRTGVGIISVSFLAHFLWKSFARNNKKSQFQLGDLWSQNGWTSHKYHLQALLEHGKGYRTIFFRFFLAIVVFEITATVSKNGKTKIWP